jgi:hypothetical protein
MIPQALVLALFCLSLGIVIAKHGQPHPNYNAGPAFLSVLMTLALLWWGGFFHPCH